MVLNKLVFDSFFFLFVNVGYIFGKTHTLLLFSAMLKSGFLISCDQERGFSGCCSPSRPIGGDQIKCITFIRYYKNLFRKTIVKKLKMAVRYLFLKNVN